MKSEDPSWREVEFERLLAQLEALSSLIAEKYPPEIWPAAVARRIRAEKGLALALQGTKQAINDVLEDLQYASNEDVAVVNERLTRAGAPPLHTLLAGRAKTVRRIMKQKQLNNETEYYLLKELVVNSDSALTDSQRALASSMLDQFERRATGAA